MFAMRLYGAAGAFADDADHVGSGARRNRPETPIWAFYGRLGLRASCNARSQRYDSRSFPWFAAAGWLSGIFTIFVGFDVPFLGTSKTAGIVSGNA